jgi:hypothetical protein
LNPIWWFGLIFTTTGAIDLCPWATIHYYAIAYLILYKTYCIHTKQKNKTRLKHFKVCENALHLYINALENANQKTQNPSRFNKKGGIGTVRFRSGSAPGEHWHFGSKSLPPASLPNFRGGTFIFHPFKIQRKHHLNFSCASQSTSEENTASKDARRRAHPLRGMSRLVNA